MNPIPFRLLIPHRAGRRPAHLPSLEQKHVPGKVIITCAITGAIHTPSMSPHLPIQPEHIAREAIAAAEAGAAILHLHARNPENGKPDQTPEAFARFLPQVKQGTNAVINITSGGSPYMRVEERVRPAAQFKPEVASLNMGSINFGLYHLLNKYTEFQFEWEREHLEATRDLIFRNSFKTSSTSCPPATTTARALNSSATTSPTCTTWPTSPTGAWSRRRSSCSRCSACWAASARTPRT